jgi:hypothetical protein
VVLIATCKSENDNGVNTFLQTVQSGSHQVHKTLSFVPLAPACVVSVNALFLTRFGCVFVEQRVQRSGRLVNPTICQTWTLRRARYKWHRLGSRGWGQMRMRLVQVGAAEFGGLGMVKDRSVALNV